MKVNKLEVVKFKSCKANIVLHLLNFLNIRNYQNFLNFQPLKLTVLYASYLLLNSSIINAQAPDPSALLDKAFGIALKNQNMAINFEGIAYGIKDPKSIFTLPVYQVARGGFFYVDGNKYEMQLGSMKSLSDGKLVVVIDEISKTMYLDSVRNNNVSDTLLPEMEKLFTETFGEGDMKYAGEETMNGHLCHIIKSTFTKGDNTHVIYWIEKTSNQLYLMAEWQNNAYDVYWFRSIARAPEKHEYVISNLPKKEIENYYGYNVIDNRFISENLK